MPRPAKKSPRLPLKEMLRPSFRRERSALAKASGLSPAATKRQGAARRSRRCRGRRARSRAHPARLKQSKKLDAEQREKLYDKICATAQVAVAFGSIERIDRDNILRASLWALARAVKALPVRPKKVFVDGNIKIDCGCDCEAVVSGDALVLSIAAASIVAKVTRDRLMMRVGLAHPGYGFERHMGYSVPEHFAALNRARPRVHHRRTFAPVAEKLGRGDRPRTSPSCLFGGVLYPLPARFPCGARTKPGPECTTSP